MSTNPARQFDQAMRPQAEGLEAGRRAKRRVTGQVVISLVALSAVASVAGLFSSHPDERDVTRAHLARAPSFQALMLEAEARNVEAAPAPSTRFSTVAAGAPEPAADAAGATYASLAARPAHMPAADRARSRALIEEERASDARAQARGADAEDHFYDEALAPWLAAAVDDGSDPAGHAEQASGRYREVSAAMHADPRRLAR